MIYLLSIGFTLLVLMLTLIVVWSVMEGGKGASPQRMGISLMVLGVLAAAFVGVAGWILGLFSQVWNALANTVIAIFLTGGTLVIQGIVQKEPAKLPIVKYGAFVVGAVGLAFIIAFFIVR